MIRSVLRSRSKTHYPYFIIKKFKKKESLKLEALLTILPAFISFLCGSLYFTYHYILSIDSCAEANTWRNNFASQTFTTQNL